MGALANSGQECCAGARVLVHAGVAEQFLDLAAEQVRSFRVGDQADGPAEIGPLITARHRERVAGFVDRALEEGARVYAQGDAPEDGFFYPPTLLTNVESGMEVWLEEVFGPVLAFDTFETDDEALKKANASRYGLAAGIWTSDMARALHFGPRLAAGVVWVNSYLSGSANAPFGGSKDSGFGREEGLAAVAEYTQVKTIFIKAPPTVRDSG
jgi:acyl-CoA reductase-like NAD-dependent aldehyde dehydrogenase